MNAPVCSHCSLPVGSYGQRREVDGETHRFCCYGCCLAYQVSHGEREEPAAAGLLIRLGVGAFLAMNIMLFSLLLYSGSLGVENKNILHGIHILLWILATPVVVFLGVPFMRNAWQQSRHGRLTADTLVSIGALAAYGYSALQVIVAGNVVYFDTATMLLVLFTLGRYLEATGRVRTVRSLAPMLDAERSTATIVDDDVDREQPVTAIRRGIVVRISPGERVPVDGVVIEGRSACNEAILTGQSEDQPKQPGAHVHAGSMNGNGQLLVRATSAGDDTRWIRMSRQIRQLLSRKSLVSELVDRVAAVFVPAVVLLAIGTVYYWNQQGDFDQALMAGLAVLVVACPCALGLAAPLASAIGLGQAAQRGILIRGGAVLERLARVNAVAFDKTGTLTTDKQRVIHIETAGCTELTLLQRMSGLAQGSEHPAARAILRYIRERGITPIPGSELQVTPGQGISGTLSGHYSAMGSANYMIELGWPVPLNLMAGTEDTDGYTRVYIGWGHHVRGLLQLSDTPKSEVRCMIETLNSNGFSTCLLSGDTALAVARSANAVGINEWYAGLMPTQKVSTLESWAQAHGAVAMVGDGLNDGPALAEASVGIAVGEATDLARETADVVLPKAALGQLPWLFQLARQVRKTILTNVGWALGYNLVALSLATAGLLLPIIAAGLMAGSSLVVVVNSLHAGQELAQQRNKTARQGVVKPSPVSLQDT